MPWLPVLLFVAQANPTEVALHYRRPSAVIASLRGVPATLVAHDDRGTVGVDGFPADVQAAREVLRLADVPRRRLLVRVTVESPVDHLTWEVDARLTSGQRWQTSDDETGTDIALEPRVNADGTLAVKVLATCRGAELKSLLRLRKGRSQTLALGGIGVQEVKVGPGKAVSVSGGQIPLPNVTVRYVGG